MKTTNFGTRLMVEDVEGLITPLPGQTFIDVLIKTISQTKYSLDVIQYQWNWYPGKPDSLMQRLNRTVLAQAEARKKVRVLLNKEGRGQHLMAINLKAKQYLSEAGVLVKFARTFPITHAKLWIFDDDVVILGSHNLSSRSVSVNNEVSALIKSRSVAMEFKRYFNILWNLY
jgi:phosphatidylserine/phosphatidylglycerophosphate/cardiolipin synthase-like enzyme